MDNANSLGSAAIVPDFNFTSVAAPILRTLLLPSGVLVHTMLS